MAIDRKYGKITAEFGSISHGGPGVPLNDSDEPCMIFRAQDVLSLAAIDGYIEAANDSNTDAPEEFIELLSKCRADFVAWQEANPDKVKLPD